MRVDKGPGEKTFYIKKDCVLFKLTEPHACFLGHLEGHELANSWQDSMTGQTSD